MTTTTLKHIGKMVRNGEYGERSFMRGEKFTLCGVPEAAIITSNIDERFVLLGEHANCPECIQANIDHAEEMRQREYEAAEEKRSQSKGR